jgi:hypothetical protein
MPLCSACSTKRGFFPGRESIRSCFECFRTCAAGDREGPRQTPEMSAQWNFLLASWTGSTKFVTFGGVSSSSSSRSLTSCMNKWMNEYRQINRYTSCQAMQTRRPDPSPFSLLDTCTVIIESDFVHLIQLPSTHSFSHPLVRKIRRQASYLQAVHKYWYISFSPCLPIAQLKICLVKTRLDTTGCCPDTFVPMIMHCMLWPWPYNGH